MPSQVKLIRENERELVFAYPYHVASWFAAFIGGGVLYLSWRSMIGGPVFLRWVVVAWGLVIAMAGIAGSLYTDRLTLDRMTRTYARRKGYLRKTTAQSGSFDDIQGVALQVEYQTSSHGQPIPYWALRLLLRNADSISLASFGNEQAAYARLDSLAKTLHVAAIDRSGDQETITQPDNLDQPLVAKRQHRRAGPEPSGKGIPPLPSGSRIDLTGAAPQRSIVLPPLGFNVGIALVFGFFALILFFMGLSGLQRQTGRTPPAHSLGIDRDYSSAGAVLSRAHPGCELPPCRGERNGDESALRPAALWRALRTEAHRQNCHRGDSGKACAELGHLSADAARSLQGLSSTGANQA